MRILGDSQPIHSKTSQKPATRKPASSSSQVSSMPEDIKRHARPLKSDSAIRAKLKARQEKAIAEAEAAKKPKQEEVKAEETVEVKSQKQEQEKVKGAKEIKEPQEVDGDMMLKSDIQKNDPNDPNVREKLKDILKSGAFKFNQKEKSALSKILADN